MRNKLSCSAVLFLASLLSPAQAPTQSSNLALLQDAAQSITAGKLDRAETDLQSVLHTTPNDHRALDLLGVVRVLQHRESDAEKLFTHAIQTQPDFAPAQAHLGLLYVKTGRSQEALPHLREALHIDPARSEASAAFVRILLDQAQTAAATGESQKALALLLDARKYAPNNPDLQFALGTIDLQISAWQDAVEAFERTLELRKNDPLAIYNLGRAFLKLSKFEEARVQFDHYVALRPDDASGHCALGMTLAALEHEQEARDQFVRSIALDSAQTESYFRLGLIDLDAKRLNEAAANLDHVISREPKHAAALSALGRVAFEKKDYSKAIDLLQQAISSDQSSRQAHYYLGLSFARAGRKDEAANQLRIATQLEHEEAERRRTELRIQDGVVSDPPSRQPP